MPHRHWKLIMDLPQYQQVLLTAETSRLSGHQRTTSDGRLNSRTEAISPEAIYVELTLACLGFFTALNYVGKAGLP